MASRAITVNAVAPGFIASPMTEGLTEAQRAGLLATIPMSRLGQGSDVAAAVLYLASDEAGYVTRSPLHVKGGMARL